MNSGLNALDNLLYIRARGNEIHIILVFIDIISKYLLALFINRIYIVYDNEFFLAEYTTRRFAKGFHFIPEEINALLLQICNIQYIVFGEIRVFR